MPIHQSVARETAEAVWTPHPSYALAALCAASPGVAGCGGATWRDVAALVQGQSAPRSRPVAWRGLSGAGRGVSAINKYKIAPAVARSGMKS